MGGILALRTACCRATIETGGRTDAGTNGTEQEPKHRPTQQQLIFDKRTKRKLMEEGQSFQVTSAGTI